MTSSTSQPRVIVIGGSLGGLNAALWLREAGCDVEVFERVPVPLEDRGAGIVLNPATIRYFIAHRLLDVTQISASAQWFRCMGNGGDLIYEEPCRYRFTSYNVLYRGLLSCFDERRYHLGEECIAFDQDADGVTVRFSSGRVERCDLLVFADGINSIGRRLLLPEVQQQYSGYVAWRGTVEEQELSPQAFAALHEAITYSLQADNHVLSYPIPNRDGTVEDGRRLTNWLWYRNVTPGAELEDLLTGRGGERFTTSVPPGFVQERHLRQLREDAAALPPAFAEMIARTREPFLQVIIDIEVPRMAFGRVCLIGDAAFTARPHAAAGSAKAAEDAWKLGEAVKACGGDVVTALERWEPGQLALGRQLVARARHVGTRLQHGRWPVGESLPFGLYEIGDSAFDDELEDLG
jgi:2,6-dihydroxypyridine 3-monooxygenase